MGRIGMSEEINQQRRGFFGTAAMAVRSGSMSEEINEPRRKLLGATALGFVAAQLGAAAPAFAQ
jgi:hypothetical protein